MAISDKDILCNENRIRLVSGFNPFEIHEMYELRSKLLICNDCTYYIPHGNRNYCYKTKDGSASI